MLNLACPFYKVLVFGIEVPNTDPQKFLNSDTLAGGRSHFRFVGSFLSKLFTPRFLYSQLDLEYLALLSKLLSCAVIIFTTSFVCMIWTFNYLLDTTASLDSLKFCFNFSLSLALCTCLSCSDTNLPSLARTFFSFCLQLVSDWAVLWIIDFRFPLFANIHLWTVLAPT